jgi:hypothetical protein
MTLQQVNQMVSSMGLPYSYYQFNEDTAQAPPFICFFYGPSDDLYADNSNYQDIRQLNIELYTTTKDFALERTIENILKLNGFSFYREENFIESEKLWQIAYEMEVLITN